VAVDFRMKCVKCGKKAVINIPYASKTFCHSCFVKYYEKRVKRTIAKHKMFTKKDLIGVGVSGGKDSIDLLYVLYKLGYNLVAITIDEGIRSYRNETIPFVKKLCRELGVPLHIYSFKKEIGKTLDEIVKKKKRHACSYCGVFRRHLLNKAARELGCDYLAVGHNLDDEAQTIMMNFFHSELDRMARSGAVTGVTRSKLFVPRVKPLREISEKENVVYALLKGLEYADVECPYVRDSLRADVREALNFLENKHPGVKIGLVHSFDKMLPFLKENFGKEQKLKKCKVCGEVTSGEVCKVCEFIKETK